MLPNGWERVHLNDLCITVTSGSRDWAKYYSDKGSKFIRMTNLQRENIYLDLADLKFVDVKSESSDGKRTSLKTSDILMSITAELGKIGWVHEGLGEAFINQHTALIRLDKSKSYSKYIAYLLSSKAMNHKINRLNDSGAKAGLNLPTIRSIPLDIPPLPEQRKIAKILSTWDKAISVTERLIDNGKQQKKALMQQLLTGKKRLLDDSGRVFEGEWEEAKLGDLSSKITKGTTPSTNGFSFQEKGINFVKVESIISRGKFDVSKFAYIDDDCHTSFKRSQLQNNDILFSIAGALGRTALVTESVLPANTNQALAIIKLKPERAVHKYVFYSLNSPNIAASIKRLSAQAAQPNLSLKDVGGLQVTLPSWEEQNKIALVLTNADQEIELLEEQLTDLKQEKKALMQQMLTGIRRVNVDTEDAA